MAPGRIQSEKLFPKELVVHYLMKCWGFFLEKCYQKQALQQKMFAKIGKGRKRKKYYFMCKQCVVLLCLCGNKHSNHYTKLSKNKI